MKLPTLIATATALLAPHWLATHALADVRYVDATGNGQHTTIQAAIDASADGDVLLVRTGTYPGFTVDNRSLWIVADVGAVVKVSATVFVRNVASGKSVLVSGLQATGAPGFNAQPGLKLENNASHVRLQGCVFKGGAGAYSSSGTPGGAGAVVVNSSRVVFDGGSSSGGNGGGIPLFVSPGGRGGDGITTQGSVVALYSCLLKGGVGGMADYINANDRAGDGGHGCHVLDFGILASACQFQGGMGGSGATIPGNGGTGLRIDNGQAQLIASTFAGGLGGQGYYGNHGQDGPAQSGTGVFNVIPGAARKATARALAAESATQQFDLAGEPGDRFWLFRSPLPEFIYSPARAGVLLASLPAFFTSFAQATLPGSGTASLTLATPTLLPGDALRRQYWQCVVVTAAGQVRLSNAVYVGVLDCSDLLPDCNGNGSCDSCDLLLPAFPDCDKNGVPDVCQPDCNGNGLADVCDISSGASVDLNHNSIPDECEPQTTWHVDVNAAPGGNGSTGSPFQALGPAFAAAIGGDTILVADGVYQGSANRDLDFGQRDLRVLSTGGAANCIIDCQQLGRAFTMDGGITPAAVIAGFTIRNGKVATESGGGLYGRNASPTIRQCIFENCEARYGGGLHLRITSSLIEGCLFIGNLANASSSGGGAYIEYPQSAGLLDCTFVDNQAHRGGGLCVYGNTLVHVGRCVFDGNTASYRGGAIFGENGALFIEQCLISGNVAQVGGGIYGYGGTWELEDSTLVDNRGTTGAGAAYFEQFFVSSRAWRNCIVWGNVSAAGTAIEVVNGPLDVDWCDVEGGQGSVTLGAQASLAWGSGNIALLPLFADPDGPDNDQATTGDNDYRLSLGSPCLDAGSNASVAADWFDLDVDGDLTEPVPFDFDGAPRFVDVPSAPDTGSGTPPLVDLGAWERP